MGYPGGKNGSGVYQAIINQLPPHEVYAEMFLGSGAVMRMKRPARYNFGIDLDAQVVAAFRRQLPPNSPAAIWSIGNGDALKALESQADLWWLQQPDTLVYLDPPYLMESRRSPRPIYRYELTRGDHRRLLRLIKRLPCMVMISGYFSEMYAQALKDWRAVSFETTTRGGPVATEWLWMNYPEPVELHDYRYLGRSFRERQDIKRMKERWRAKLRNMPAVKRYAMLEALSELRSELVGNGALIVSSAVGRGNDLGPSASATMADPPAGSAKLPSGAGR